MDDSIHDDAACAACDLTFRLRTDLSTARRALVAAEVEMDRAIDLLFAGRAGYPRELASRVDHDRSRVEALEHVLADLVAGHGGCHAA